ncbi:MAG: HlyD family type I secretion periplasmic adaptor subunit [Alphaproteobacteria bacterium]|nr:HlyD family type I secretion periplasmic adaptor subunit [Alphaproteobacteria bacterium]MCW5744311.1 HlyD family type I secretion periplasmic adaptor subunit [Alphaproteobacteria bacterium]
MWGIATVGWVIVLLFFGGFGYWAATAPLHGAVVATGVVKVEGNRRSLQHLDGGIVRELRVKEGDQVAVGDVVIVLDDTQVRAEFEVLSRQFLVLRATEERLKAELKRADAMTLPADLVPHNDNVDFTAVWTGQLDQFTSRRAALEGARQVIREKIAQLEHQITGGEGAVKSYRTQIASVKAEMEDIKPLLDKKLIARPRFLQLERSGIQLEGQLAEAQAAIAKSRQAITEQHQQIAQLENDRMTEVTRDLRDTQARLLEVLPKLGNAKAVLSRMEIRSPYAGRVVALNVFSVGGVIGRGEKILDIVPTEDALVIEAQVAVEDIAEVRPNMRAEVHLTAYKQRITPMVNADVVQVSADRLVDQKSGQPYYVALLRIDQQQLADLPQIQLYPGMPAQVNIPTVERTALDYIVGPLVQAFSHSFRQR